MNCPNCSIEDMEVVDTTYCNYNSPRFREGEHTGNIYYCPVCECNFILRVNEKELSTWSY